MFFSRRRQPRYPRKNPLQVRRIAALFLGICLMVGLAWFGLRDDREEGAPAVVAEKTATARPGGAVPAASDPGTASGVEAGVQAGGFNLYGAAAAPGVQVTEDDLQRRRQGGERNNPGEEGAAPLPSRAPSQAPAAPSLPAVALAAPLPANALFASAQTYLQSENQEKGRAAYDRPRPLYAEAVQRYQNPWGQPFVGYSLEEVAAILGERHSALKVSAGKTSGVHTALDTAAFANRGVAGKIVALTLNACDGQKVGPEVAGFLAFLRQNRIPATIFVASEWLNANKATFMEIAKEPLFELAAHGRQNMGCTVKTVPGEKSTASVVELVTEVEGTLRDIWRTASRRPRWFRCGTGLYDNVAVAIMGDLAVSVAGSTLALPGNGPLPPAGEVEKRLSQAKNGDIFALRLDAANTAFEPAKLALPELARKGFTFVRLSDSLAP